MTLTHHEPGPVPPVDRMRGGWFLRKFLREPRAVASVWPSSRWLCRAMLDGLVLAPGEGVVELGPGTGAFTRGIEQLLRSVPAAGYLGIDRDGDFVAHLRQQFPQREFVQASAFDLPELLRERPQLRVRAVLSGLPLVSMPKAQVDELLRFVAAMLPPGGEFRTFSYVHTMASRSSWWLRGLMKRHFAHFRVDGPIWRNVPPALVFVGRV